MSTWVFQIIFEIPCILCTWNILYLDSTSETEPSFETGQELFLSTALTVP